MSATCPNGHLSTAEDYCDTCGVPIEASGGSPKQPYAAEPASPGTPASPAAGSGAPANVLDLGAPTTGAAAGSGPAGGSSGSLDCPNCQAPNAPGALFCEACGYDFTTGAMPRVAEPAGSAHSTDVGGAGSAHSTEAAAASSAPEASATSPASSSPETPASAQGAAFEWLAEVWIDPDWYQTQEAEDPCPSPGLPVIIPLRARSVLMGRVSQSRNTHPEIDLSSDPGVSRRHAQLTTDGVRWFVEDLRSSNGTFVGPASGPLPEDPIAVGPRTELGDDDRLYVGAWSRVVVRKATPDEVEAYA